MMYVLTEQEYADLKAQAEQRRVVAVEGLQAFCTRVANELPIYGWHTHGEGAKPWGCILNETQIEWYCDDCPAADFCPHPHKQWSK